MATKFSVEQQQAIDAKGNVIVSAGAGSGKTTVMVERVVKKLLAGSKLDKMLIVTFTRASAADIRVKLAERLTALKNDGGKSRDVAAEALESLPVCNIGTLHSFCQRLIRTYYYATEYDPSSTLCDEEEAKSLKVESIRKAVRAARAAGDATTCTVLDALSGRRDDKGAVETIEGILDFALSLSNTREYLKEVDEDSNYYAMLDNEVALKKDALLAEAKLLKADIDAAGFEYLKKPAAELFGYIEHGFEIASTRYSGSDADFKKLNERFQALKAQISEFREYVSDVETAKKIESSPFAVALCAVALDALDRYKEKKAVLGKIDYSDLEHGALDVLSDDACMSEIASAIDFVFIDEYQDVNPLQARIAARLKDGAKAEMFLVGDIKQSIYAFRRCNPKFFRDALEDKDYTKVLLNRNYRSSEEVIKFINDVFDGIMRSDFGGADYSVDKLICGNPTSGSAEFYAAPAPGRSNRTKVEDEPPYSVVNAKKGVEREDVQARKIVDMILDHVENDPDSGFGSVAVLMRSTKTAFCDALISLMRANGIPCKLGKKCSASDYPEVTALLGIARCIDNRFDDVALYTALRSSMGGFSDRELLEIATEGEASAVAKNVFPEIGFSSDKRSYYFWQKVKAYDGRHKARLDEFFERREMLSDYAKRHDAADALGRLTSEIDFFQYVFENGGNASAVEALIAVAAAKNCTLSAFLAVADDVEIDAGEGGDAVTVTTIHASKGLEYDFVIVADIGHKINKKDFTKKCMTGNGSVSVKYPDSKGHKLKPAAKWMIEKSLVPRRALAEELRLFYVALTRAKKKLVVTGLKPSKAHSPEDAVYMYDFMKNKESDPLVVTPRDSGGTALEESSVDNAIIDAVRERIAAAYVPKDIPIKTCVTAIAESEDDGDYTAFAPVLTYDDRDGEEQASGDTPLKSDGAAAKRGTAYHRAMELIDFDDPDIEKVKSETADAELVDFDVILKAAAEMKTLTAGAAAYYKERYFIAEMPIDGENTLVQGVIDLLIINADGTATIVDYKTTAPAHLKSENYLKQLALYAAAVEKSAPAIRVTSTYLYSFALGKSIKCNRA